jgi:alpha-beta hydrolase superfamily lysophospholipase
VTTYGFHAAAIDAPGHGDRERSASDAAWVDRMLRARAADEPLGAIVAEFNGSIADRAVPEWQSTLDALTQLPDIDAERPVGYSGMTLATEIGLRLAATDTRIGVAGLGAAFASDGLLEVARTVTVPVQYLLPWDDREIDRESGIALWDAIGSADQSLHVFPGPHEAVPASEAEDAARFIARHLTAG